MTPRRVVVLGGGRSSEHEVSLASAQSVADGLRESGHDVVAVTIGRDGRWTLAGETEVLSLTPGAGLLGAEVAFPVLHGPFGEDGTVQGLLEVLDVAYVGSGVLASAVCMDKIVFKELMAQGGVPQVDYRGVRLVDWREDPDGVRRSLAGLPRPVFVKPARLGSSVGIARVGSSNGDGGELVSAGGPLDAALEAAFAHDSLVIVEAGSPGLEVECSVIGDDDPVASQPGQILLAAGEAGWYDYAAKYTPGGMRLEVPARLPESVRERVRELAVEVFLRSGCAGLARVDFFVEGETVLVNELNTMPGFTPTSVFGSLFAASGLPYPALLNRLVEFAVQRHARSRSHRF